jgi:hypothetical protein
MSDLKAIWRRFWKSVLTPMTDEEAYDWSAFGM